MDSPSEQPKLTHRQEAFVAAYCGEARFNATKAAVIAGYSAKNAARIGHELKKHPSIRARIDEQLESESMTASEVLNELTDVAMRGLDEFVEIVARDVRGNAVAARMDAKAKMAALDSLAKAHGLYTEKVQHSGGIAIEIAGVDVSKL